MLDPSMRLCWLVLMLTQDEPSLRPETGAQECGRRSNPAAGQWEADTKKLEGQLRGV